MHLARFCYISLAEGQLTDSDLRDLQDRAGTYNARHGLTGLLLFDGARFAQLVEGPASDLDLAIDRIRKDDRHKALQVIQHAPAEHRLFSGWALKAEWQSRPYHSEALLNATKAAVAHITELSVVAFFIGFARIST